jgi:hypothetical protein
MTLEVPTGADQVPERSAGAGSLVKLAQLVDDAHHLQAEHDRLQGRLTGLGQELLSVRGDLAREGVDVTFNLTTEVMKGIERAAEAPQQVSEPRLSTSPPPGY